MSNFIFQTLFFQSIRLLELQNLIQMQFFWVSVRWGLQWVDFYVTAAHKAENVCLHVQRFGVRSGRASAPAG